MRRTPARGEAKRAGRTGTLVGMLSTVLTLAAEAEEHSGAHHTELPFSQWVFGGIALALFALALAALWSFRGTAHKFADGAHDGDHAHGAGAGEAPRTDGSHAPADSEHDVVPERVGPARSDAPSPDTRQHPNHD